MSFLPASFYCPGCRKQRLFTTREPGYFVHFFLTLFLCGLWLPILLAVRWRDQDKFYFCSECGLADYKSNIINPRCCERCQQLTARSSSSCLNCGFQPPTFWTRLKNSSWVKTDYSDLYRPLLTSLAVFSVIGFLWYFAVPRLLIHENSLPAPTRPQETTVNQTALNSTTQLGTIKTAFAELKREPKSGSPTITILTVGDKVEIIEKYKTWVRIKTGNSTGWIHENFIELK